jgi:TP901 family phage tail tape measure protein
MGRRFIIQTDYKSDGSQVLKTQSKMSRSFSRLATNMADKNSMISRSFGKVNQSINRVAMVGLVALIGAFGLAANEFIKFDQTITGANARFKDTVLGSQQAVTNLALLKKEARAVAATSQFLGTETAAGLNFYAKAGFTTTEAMAVLADTIDLATVAEADFNRTADISSDLLGALGKNVQDSAKKIENLKDINRALGLTANSANVDLEDLFETLKVAAPIATAAGEGMHELFAITGALGGAGIKGSMGATALKNAYIRLAAPTDKVTAALDRLGLSQKDFVTADGDMKSMVNIMKQLGDASKDLGNADQLGIFSEIFGKNAVAGAVNLSKSLSEIEFIMAKLESATALKDLADEIRTGLGMQIEILKSGLLELGFQFVETFEKDGRGALEEMIKSVQSFDIQPIVEISKVFVSFIKFIAKNWKTLVIFAAGIKAVGIAMGILTIATQFFGVALAATPVGMIITAVFLFGAALAFLWTHIDEVNTVVKIMGNWFKWLGKVILDFLIMVGKKILNLLLAPIRLAVSIIQVLAEKWDAIKKSFADGGFLNGILGLGKTLLSAVLAPIQAILELISKIPGIGNLAKGGALKIEEIRKSLIDFKDIPEQNKPEFLQPEQPTPQFPSVFNTNTAQTPQPTPPEGSSGSGTLDININDKSNGNAEVKQSRNMPIGVNIGISPTYGF